MDAEQVDLALVRAHLQEAANFLHVGGVVTWSEWVDMESPQRQALIAAATLKFGPPPNMGVSGG